MHRNKKFQKLFGAGCHTMLTVKVNENDRKIVINTTIFLIICKINNQSSVANADSEIPTLGSMDNAGNWVNLISGIILLSLGWDFSYCIRDQ